MPLKGSQPSFSAKMIISISPSQNPGMAEKNMASVVNRLSSQEYCFTAEMMPSTTPRPQPTIVDVTARQKVQEKRDRIASNTGFPLR